MAESNHGIDRRTVLRAGIALGVGRVASRAGEVQADPAAAAPRPGDVLVRLNDASRIALVSGDIRIGAMPVAAWPMDPIEGIVRSGTRLNQVLLLRLDPDTLTADTRPRAADGVVAYTMICTHNGCDVDDWIAKEHLLSCSCHDSRFDPKDGAAVVDGPAPRPLPALPLKIVDGKLTVAAPFTSRVGFEKG